jgi:phosphonate transport system substrate-binding protein
MSRLRAFVLLLCALVSCSDEPPARYSPTYAHKSPDATTQYVLAPHPLHNPNRLFETYQPLVRYLNERLGLPNVELVFEASRSYGAFEAKLYAGQYHFALPNPYQTIMALEHGYSVIGKMDNDEDFRGVIVLRKDSPIKTPRDLKGKTISFPAPTALAATMMPQLFLAKHGLNIVTDFESRYVGAQESVLMDVFMGRSAAGATWPLPWRKFQQERPEAAEALRVQWTTDSLPSNGVAVRNDTPRQLVERVSTLLFSLQETPEGRSVLNLLQIPRFAPASRETYEPVRAFLREYEAQTRKAKE